MEITDLKLGSKLRDTITGFEGTAVASHYYLNGCVRVSLQSNTLKDGKTIDAESFDIQQLELLVRVPMKEKAASVGGPYDAPKRTPVPKGY